ncbi:MAG: YopX family protein [Lentisphaeraceae bacterium]|nr:YopX family protein [Lentisphaeraceae bacterium]
MREILFRGKTSCDIESRVGTWKYGFYKTVGNQHRIMTFEEHGWYPWIVDGKTVGQYINVDDSYGNKIFEGDQLQVDDGFDEPEIYQVIYSEDEEYPAFELKDFPYCESNSISHVKCCDTTKVIGNIHDNPELMQVKS